MGDTRQSFITDSTTNKIARVVGTGSQTALNVHHACIHSEVINTYAHQHTGVEELLSVAASPNDVSITVADGATFTSGNYIQLKEGDTTTTVEPVFRRINTIATNLLTLDGPLANAYTTATVVEEVGLDMNVSGSLAAPEVYIIKPPLSEIWHITKLSLHIADDSAMDDGKFGGITALTNGVHLRTLKSSVYRDIANWKTNQEIILDVSNTEYSAKAPAGLYGFSGNWNLTEDNDVSFVLDGSKGDTIQVLIQDNLSALSGLQIKAQGHIEL